MPEIIRREGNDPGRFTISRRGTKTPVKMSGGRWAGGSRDHEYVESITMYRADDSAGDDTDDDLDYKDDVDMQISVSISNILLTLLHRELTIRESFAKYWSFEKRS